MKNKFIGGKCQVGSCEKGLWRSDKTQLQTAPPPRTGMWYFHVGSLSSKPTAAWHTPLWSVRRGRLMHPSSAADIVWEWMSGQSRQRASPSRTHSQCTRALKCINLHFSGPSVYCWWSLRINVNWLDLTRRTAKDCIWNSGRNSCSNSHQSLLKNSPDTIFWHERCICWYIHYWLSSNNLSNYSCPEDSLIDCLW